MMKNTRVLPGRHVGSQIRFLNTATKLEDTCSSPSVEPAIELSSSFEK